MGGARFRSSGISLPAAEPEPELAASAAKNAGRRLTKAGCWLVVDVLLLWCVCVCVCACVCVCVRAVFARGVVDISRRGQVRRLR